MPAYAPGILASPRSTPRFVAVERDDEGVRLALREMLEESFQAGRTTNMAPAVRAQHLVLAESRRTLSPGYYRWAAHLFLLDAERNAGIPLDANTLAATEANGLRMLAAARNEYKVTHPSCSRCGAEQESRHHPQCTACGAKFTRKGGA